MPRPEDVALSDRVAAARLCADDRALPALDLMLDDALLTDWLSHRLGEPVRARRRYLRYKPGTACVAAVELEEPADTAVAQPRIVMVGHWAETAGAKLDKTVEQAGPGAVLAADPESRLLVAPPAADRDLAGPALLEEPRRRVRTLAMSLGWEPETAREPTVLSYKPQRRWVASVVATSGDTEHRLLVRAYRRGDLAARSAAARVLSGTDAPVSVLLGTRRRHGMAVHAWAEGRQLRLPEDASALPTLGATIGRLHACHAPSASLLVHSDPGRRKSGLRRTAGLAAALRPDLSARLHAAADAAADALVRLAPAPAVLLHGDLSTDQVVLAPDRTLRLVDLDRACLGPAADDLGSLVATAPTPSEGFTRLAAVLPAYSEHLAAPRGGDVAVHAAVHLLERCTDGFRSARPDWSAAIERSLSGAERLLERREA